MAGSQGSFFSTFCWKPRASKKVDYHLASFESVTFNKLVGLHRALWAEPILQYVTDQLGHFASLDITTEAKAICDRMQPLTCRSTYYDPENCGLRELIGGDNYSWLMRQCDGFFSSGSSLIPPLAPAVSRHHALRMVS